MLDLDKLSKYREGNRVEAKKALGGLPHNIWETYSAFANTNGGYILLGVEELPNKSLSAVLLPDPEILVREFWNNINNRQKINVNILAEKHVRIEDADGKHIIVIEVPRANREDKPVYVGADPFAGTYRRNGEGDYHCTKDEVRNMMRDQADVSQDMRVLEYLALDAFDPDSVRRYRIRWQNMRSGHAWESLSDEEFLRRVGAIGRSEDGTLHPTAAGVLMFGFEYEIVKEFPYYFLDYQEHDDASTRWTDRIVSNLGDWSGNIFDFYYRVAHRITHDVKTPFLLDGFSRIDDTPVHKAIREALANALIHADYYERRGLVIHRIPRCVTIANPGGLRVSMDDAVFGGISDPRNVTLLKLFGMINVAERAGTGLSGIYAVWEKEGWQAPTLEEKFGPDRTVLCMELPPQSGDNEDDDEKVAIKCGDNEKVAIKCGDKEDVDEKVAIKCGDKEDVDEKVAIKCGDNEKVAISEQKKQAIINHLAGRESCGSKELSDLIGVNASRTKVYLQELIADGIVAAEGANKNRTYRLNKPS